MKLSVKWLAGLAVLVLAVVAVVGSTSATKAATGTIFVVNEWSTVTNESPAPTGRVSRGSVYATINDGTRLIETNADLVRVVVKDTDLNQTVIQVVTNAANIDVDPPATGQTISKTVGNSAVIQLTGLGSNPIAGTLADVIANTVISVDGGTTNLAGTQLAITNFFPGGGVNPPWIQVVVNIGGSYTINHVAYQTSAIDKAIVTVKSELETAGITITVEETGLSTGIFEGFVRLVPDTATSVSGPDITGGALDGTIDPATAGLIRTITGPVTASFDDAGTTRQTSVLVDTAAPAASISGPANGTATQNQRPTFSGSVSEIGAGLDVSSIQVIYDRRDDAANTTDVLTISAPSVSIPGVENTDWVNLAPSTSGAVDGDTAFSFSQAPTADLPNAAITNPDHLVDWAIKASDLAGNIGVSDSDGSTAGVQLPTVKIDKVLPSFSTVGSDHKTGLATSSTGQVTARNSLRVVFNDQVTNIQPSDFTVTLDSTAVVVPTAVTVVNNPTAPAGFAGRSLVYLTFSSDLVSSETPVVALQDTISDLAGNFTTTGSTAVQDGIAPKVTVTLTGGSGTGQALATGEGPDKLTKEELKINVTTDETTGAPTVTVAPDGGAVELTPVAQAQGGNMWTATYKRSAVSPVPTDGVRAVKVVTTDSAANSETIGGNDASASGTPSFTLDSSLATPTLSVGGGSSTTDQRRPSIVIDFKNASPSEASTVVLTKVQLDTVDITADVVTASDGKRFFYIPPADLSIGTHDLLIEAGDAVDAAGNENAGAIPLTVTIQERQTFDLDMFAGWNALSFPSNPVDNEVGSVFTNAGHDLVLGFDPTLSTMWAVAQRDTATGDLIPATENGLTTVRATQAYWVHSNNFEQVQVILVGEEGLLPGSPPEIIMIPTVQGFNAVPVVDTSRKLTFGGAAPLTRQVPGGGTPVSVDVRSYIGAVEEGRVYSWEPEILSFVLMSPGDGVSTGMVLFVEVTGDPVDIVP